MDKMLKAALDWINAIAYPNAGFVHPNDENKVKCASRALDSMNVTVDKNEVKDYCMKLGMPQESIDKIVDWFSRPKGINLKNGMSFSNKSLIKIWSRE